MEDIIENYCEVVKKYLDAPETFIRSSAYHLVSSLLGQFFRCAHIGTSTFGLRPNTWFIISSIPGRTRRSTVAGYADKVYKESLKGFHMRPPKAKRREEEEDEEDIPDEEERGLDQKTAWQMTEDSVIEEGTVEGITDHIEHTHDKLNSYVIASSEFGSVLTRMNTKDYQVGVSSLLSKLYYGEGGSMMLSQRSKESRGPRHLPPNLYVTMYAGMQEPKYYLTPVMIRQGLMRRILLIYAEPKDMKNKWIPPIEMFRSEVKPALKTFNDIFTDKMIEYKELAITYSNPPLIPIFFKKDAYNRINEYARKNDKALEEEVVDFNIYKQGFWEHITKIAMLHAISRDNLTSDILDKPEYYQLDVEMPDVDKAFKFVEEATKYNCEIISNLARVDIPIQSAQLPIERIYSVIAEYNQRGITRTELYRRTNMTSKVLTDYVSALIIQDRIEQIEEKTGSKPIIIYKVKK